MSQRAVPSLVLAASLLAGCSSAHETRAPLPPPAQIINVTITAHHYGYNPTIRSGRTVFVGHNVDRAVHVLILYPIADDVPPVDVQLHGTHRVSIQMVAGMQVNPGMTDSFALDLVRHQRYFMLDFGRGPDGTVYALHGLDSEFRAE